jgi:hypothetical protein
MKSDIPFYPVEGIQIAIARKKNELEQFEWFVYLLNKNDYPIYDVLVTSKGYGEKEGEEQKTSTLRHMIGYIGPNSNSLIEPIDPALFHLFNQFWVSYYVADQIYDKKFIFVPESITDENIIPISDLDMEGVLHK